MSFFDDASLVMIPSGYKTSKVYSVKPTDGTGDLAFTRSNDTATRVGPDGLIEKVRTNLILQSQDFTTNWGGTSLSVTANTTANPLNGAVNADTITLTGATTQKFIAQSFVFSGNYTTSVYLKAGTHQFVQLMLGTDPTPFANFDLVNGTASATGSTATIVSAGSGWYRCSMSFTSVIGTTVFITAADSLATSRFQPTASTGTYIAFGYQLETGDIATPYIATTTAAVSVGPVANVPRLDYLNSSCPKLLLEPQRTNLALNSESFNNATWTKSNATITANTTVSPDGTQSADTAVITAGGYIYAEFFPYAAVTGQSATLSVFAKNATSTLLVFGGATTAGTDVYKIENYGNGWYRHSVVRTFTATASTTLQFIIDLVGTSILWGAQVEGSNSAYATSYIPTLGASVTRGADACSKTGISSLIGQTEGTLFLEMNINKRVNLGGLGPNGIEIRNATNSAIYLGTAYASSQAFGVYINNAGSFSTLISTSNNALGTYKMAVGYSSAGFVFYLNGVQIGTSATLPPVATYSDFGLITFDGLTTAQGELIEQALLFKTRLSNSDLAALTA